MSEKRKLIVDSPRVPLGDVLKYGSTLAFAMAQVAFEERQAQAASDSNAAPSVSAETPFPGKD